MQKHLHARRKHSGGEVSVSVAQEQQRLVEEHARRPDTRRPAEPR